MLLPVFAKTAGINALFDKNGEFLTAVPLESSVMLPKSIVVKQIFDKYIAAPPLGPLKGHPNDECFVPVPLMPHSV